MSRTGKSALALLAAFAVSAAAAQSAGVDDETRASQDERAARAEEIDVALREAEERLADAAARVAELSRRRLPETYAFERRIRIADRPMLGVTIGADDDEGGPVEGVTIRGVTPGGAAAEAGLRAGDVITAVNDESLSAESAAEANRRLLELLDGVEEGNTLDVEYLRNGKSATADVTPRSMPGQVFAFGRNDDSFLMRALPAPGAPGAPGAPLAPPNMFSFFVGGGSWGDMEMVSLTSDLGRYFGTDKGLLVVRAPADEKLKLRDGDVIRRIDGREPMSVSHAMRILGSYQGGETLEFEIMRDRKQQTLSVEVPDNRSSFAPPTGPAPRTGTEDVLLMDAPRDVPRERT